MENIASWPAFYKALHDISVLASNRPPPLLPRCVAVLGLSPEQQRAALKHVGEIVSFDWETMGQRVGELLPLIAMLQGKFDADKVCNGVNETGLQTGSVKINADIIKKAGLWFQHSFIYEKGVITKAFCRAIDKAGTWCDGCSCHEHLLVGPAPWREKVRRYSVQSAGCCRKGLRGSARAIGHWRQLLEQIEQAGIRGTKDVVLQCEVADRTQLLAFADSMRTSVMAALRQQLKFWGNLPHALMGLFAHEDDLGRRNYMQAAWARPPRPLRATDAGRTC